MELREALESALNDPDDTSAPAQAPAPVAEAPAPVVEPARTDDRPRDEAGRFAPKAGETQNAVPTPAPPPLVDQQAAPAPVVPGAPDLRQDLPPRSLRPAIKEKWATLDADVKSEIWRRERETMSGINSYKARAEAADRLESVYKPFEADMQQAGVTPEQAIASFFQTHRLLRTADPQTKLQKFHELARTYGVDLRQQPAPVDVRYQTLQNEIESLKSERQRELDERQRAQTSRLTSDIEAFAEGREHFDDVRADMAALLQGGSAHDLETAYDMAIWARPDLRSRLLEQQRAEADKKAREAATSARAKAASVSVRGSSPANASAGPPTTIRGAIEAALNQT